MPKSKVDGEIILKDVRASYLHCFKAKAFENTRDDDDNGKGSGPKFSSKFILDKKKHKNLIADIEDKIAELEEAENDGKRLKPEKVCLRDGDDEDGEEFHGAMVLSASNSKRPQIVDRNKEPLVEADGKPYSGCYVNAVVRLWFQNNKYGRRVNASLEAIQYYREGAAFGAPPVDVDKKFDSFEDEEGGSERGRSARRSRDTEDEEPQGRSSRRSSRDRDEDEGESRSSRRSRDEDDSRSSRRGRDRDEGGDDEGDRERGRSSRRSRDD